MPAILECALLAWHIVWFTCTCTKWEFCAIKVARGHLCLQVKTLVMYLKTKIRCTNNFETGLFKSNRSVPPVYTWCTITLALFLVFDIHVEIYCMAHIQIGAPNILPSSLLSMENVSMLTLGVAKQHNQIPCHWWFACHLLSVLRENIRFFSYSKGFSAQILLRDL